MVSMGIIDMAWRGRRRTDAMVSLGRARYQKRGRYEGLAAVRARGWVPIFRAGQV